MSRDSLVEKLKRDIAAKDRVVIVAGTGVSVAACGNQRVDGHNVATWTGLLRHGAEYCKELGVADEKLFNLINQEIDTGETDFLTGAAEKISQRMQKRGAGVYRGWLKDTIGQLRVQDAAILQALDALPAAIATLNYDGLIEAATGRHPVTWRQADKTQAVLRQEIEHAVLHLHGWFEEPESVVLGLSSYLTVKDDPHAQSVLESLCMQRAMLLVGCGDTVLDPNFSRLIEWARETLDDVAPRHYLLCRASEVAAFQKKLHDAPWLQPLSYGSEYGDLVPFLKSLVPSASSSPPIRPRTSSTPAFDLDQYRKAMRKHYGRLKLEELDPTTHDIRPLMLTGMFIAQNARECAEFMPRVFELPKELQRRLREVGELEGEEIDEETLEQYRRAYVEQTSRPVLEFVNNREFSRLVILGDPGSGKSTLLQYVLLSWAECAGSTPGQGPLPIVVALREYARRRHEGEKDGFLGYLHDGASVRWHFDQAHLHTWLKNNPSVILFDGLDEVFDQALRREISTAIHRFADEYPQAQVIVTSRIIGYQHHAWRDENFRHVMLQELDEGQITDFVVRWHRAAYEDPVKGEAKRVLLGRAMEDSEAIRQLAGNPLLLTMMAVLNRTQDLPRDRAELYEQCARLLLHRWKVDAAFAPDPELAKASLDFQDKRGLLLRVARAMQTSERGLAGNLIDEATLESTLAEGLKGIIDGRPERAARALIHQLRGQNFMLCSVGGGCYAFVHRTFLEFFCALDIRARFEAEQSLSIEDLTTQIFGHWHDETWHEVLCLLAGMIAPHFLAQILEWLLAQSDPDDTCHHIFLAARCVGEVRKRGELGATETAVRERTKALTRFDLRRSDGQWRDSITVSQIQARAVTTVAKIWATHSDTRDWLTGLVQSDDLRSVRNSALDALANGWNDSETLVFLSALCERAGDLSLRQNAVRAVARGWKDDPTVLPWLKKNAMSNEDWGIRQAAVQALALEREDKPGIGVILKARAQFDDDSDVRRSAIDALAHGWKDDPQTLALITEAAQFDEHPSVRLGGIYALAGELKNDPRTLAILKTRAQSDEVSVVRRTVLEQIVFAFKGDPGILSWLTSNATLGEDSAIRRDALEVLAQEWGDDPRVLEILKARAQSDEDADVRQYAVQALAETLQGDPQTKEILKARAQSDDDPHVRQAAVEALTSGWRDDPAISSWVKATAMSGTDDTARRIAILALAYEWKDDPQTLEILRMCARSNGAPDVRRSAIQALAEGWQHDPQTFEILQACAQSDDDAGVRQSALQALAHGWEDHPQTLEILVARAQSDDDAGVRQSALQALTGSWNDDPRILEIFQSRAQLDDDSTVRHDAVQALMYQVRDFPKHLEDTFKTLAQSDVDPDVRQIAVQALARLSKDDPQALEILKVRAQSDDASLVRQRALGALVRKWMDDPQILEILKRRAQADDDSDVRRSAVKALASESRLDPQIFEILMTRAQADIDPDVRRTAVQALGRKWKGDPRTFEILKVRAQSDDDPAVRGSAVDALLYAWPDDPLTLELLKKYNIG